MCNITLKLERFSRMSWCRCETIPLDAVPAGEGYVGFWTRRPVGVIAAISPFNFPLNLVAHKVAPAIAVGSLMVLKVPPQAPLLSFRLAEILAEVSGLTYNDDVRHGRFGMVGERTDKEIGMHAVRGGDEKLTEEVLEEVSQPGHGRR